MPGAAYLARLLQSREKRAVANAARWDDRCETMAQNGGNAAREIDDARREVAVNDEASMPCNELNWGDRRQVVRSAQVPLSQRAIREWFAFQKAQVQCSKELLASGAVVSLGEITEVAIEKTIEKTKKIQSSLSRRAKRRANRKLKYAKAQDS